MKIIERKISLSSLFEYIILILIIFDGVTMWKFLSNGPRYQYGLNYNILGYISTVFMLLYLFFKYIRKGISRKLCFGLLLFAFYNLSYFVLNHSNNSSLYLTNFAIPLLVMIMFCYNLIKENILYHFLIKYKNLVFFLALISLVLYVGGTILNVIPHSIVHVYRSNIHQYDVNSYFHLMYNGQEQTVFGHTFYRNTGIFLEGPGWIYPICLALFIELFLNNKISKFTVFVLVATGLTTFSSKGFLAMPIIFILDFMQNKNNRNSKTKIIKYMILPILLIVFVIFVGQILISKQTYESASYFGRMEDIILAWKTWMEYPILGCGYGNTSTLSQYLSSGKTTSNTAGSLKVLAQCGLFIGVEYYGSLYFLYRFSNDEKKYTILAFLIIFIIFLSTSSTWYYWDYMFIIALGIAMFIYKSNFFKAFLFKVN